MRNKEAQISQIPQLSKKKSIVHIFKETDEKMKNFTKKLEYKQKSDGNSKTDQGNN